MSPSPPDSRDSPLALDRDFDDLATFLTSSPSLGSCASLVGFFLFFFSSGGLALRAEQFKGNHFLVSSQHQQNLTSPEPLNHICNSYLTE